MAYVIVESHGLGRPSDSQVLLPKNESTYNWTARSKPSQRGGPQGRHDSISRCMLSLKQDQSVLVRGILLIAEVEARHISWAISALLHFDEVAFAACLADH